MRVSIVCHACFALFFTFLLLDDTDVWHAPNWLITGLLIPATATIPINTYTWLRGRNNPSDDD
jgi:hypothetical protein